MPLCNCLHSVIVHKCVTDLAVVHYEFRFKVPEFVWQPEFFMPVQVAKLLTWWSSVLGPFRTTLSNKHYDNQDLRAKNVLQNLFSMQTKVKKAIKRNYHSWLILFSADSSLHQINLCCFLETPKNCCFKGWIILTRKKTFHRLEQEICSFSCVHRVISYPCLRVTVQRSIMFEPVRREFFCSQDIYNLEYYSIKSVTGRAVLRLGGKACN